jgi:hypothetical protein
MKYIFWISWIIDAGVAVWWVISELGYEYLKPNTFSFVFLLYVVATLLVYLLTVQTKTAMIMSLIPAVPLVAVGLIAMIAILTGAKWN